MDSTPLAIYIGLARTLKHINQQSNRLFEQYGITAGQFAVLEVLYHKGDLCVGEVQEKILSSTGTIGVILGNLEKLGYLTKYSDVKDKRKSLLHITEQGSALMAEVFPKNEAIIATLLGVWSSAEQAELQRLLLQYREQADGKLTQIQKILGEHNEA